jgi:hypothetical protein
MKKYISLVLAVASLLTLTGQAFARTVHHPVTPENIDKQARSFTVKAKAVGQDFEFEITVKSVGISSLSVSSPITMVQSNGVQTYTFRVSARELDKAQFTYTETLRDWSQPFAGSGDYWVFSLRDFAGSSRRGQQKTSGPR